MMIVIAFAGAWAASSVACYFLMKRVIERIYSEYPELPVPKFDTTDWMFWLIMTAGGPPALVGALFAYRVRFGDLK